MIINHIHYDLRSAFESRQRYLDSNQIKTKLFNLYSKFVWNSKLNFYNRPDDCFFQHEQLTNKQDKLIQGLCNENNNHKQMCFWNLRLIKCKLGKFQNLCFK